MHLRQAVKADAEDMEVFLDQHSPQRQQYNIKVTADLKEHPDFKRFEEWRAQHKVKEAPPCTCLLVKSLSSCRLSTCMCMSMANHWAVTLVAESVKTGQ